MTALVLDATVAAKWFLPADTEPYSEDALRLLHDYSRGKVRLVIPDLFWPEFGNILWKAVRQKRISVKSADESVAMMLERGIPTTPSGPLLKDAFDLAVCYDRAVYDAVYVTLAVLSNMPLITADERLANALAARFPIRWLGAYSSPA